jgi:hypothetical protein
MKYKILLIFILTNELISWKRRFSKFNNYTAS